MKIIKNLPGVDADDKDLYFEAKELVAYHQRALFSELQKKLEIGYAKAHKLMDRLEQEGLVGPDIEGSPRRVYMEQIYELPADGCVNITKTEDNTHSENMNWTDEYREIIEFYYWEPQHLGRAGGPKKFANATQMWAHVNKIEVSLNHILNIFFSLYSSRELFERLGSVESSYDFMSSRQHELLQRDLGGFTQPDMYFSGNRRNLAIELKLGAKSNIDQITKYIVFNHCTSGNKGLDLMLLSPYGQLPEITKEKFEDIGQLKAAISYKELSPKIQLLCTKVDFESQVKLLAIETLSINKFIDTVRSLKPSNETERKLVTGLYEYMQSRGL